MHLHPLPIALAASEGRPRAMALALLLFLSILFCYAETTGGGVPTFVTREGRNDDQRYSKPEGNQQQHLKIFLYENPAFHNVDIVECYRLEHGGRAPWLDEVDEQVDVVQDMGEVSSYADDGKAAGKRRRFRLTVRDGTRVAVTAGVESVTLRIISLSICEDVEIFTAGVLVS